MRIKWWVCNYTFASSHIWWILTFKIIFYVLTFRAQHGLKKYVVLWRYELWVCCGLLTLKKFSCTVWIHFEYIIIRSEHISMLFSKSIPRAKAGNRLYARETSALFLSYFSIALRGQLKWTEYNSIKIFFYFEARKTCFFKVVKKPCCSYVTMSIT